MNKEKYKQLCEAEGSRIPLFQQYWWMETVCEGQQWVSHAGERPDGFCDSAWESMRWFVAELAAGRGNFYDGWMRNPYSALISCNDGFRPVSFLLERLEPGT